MGTLEKLENNSNVSNFPSNPEHDKIYPVIFDVMPPLWACYASYARVVDIGVDMIISDGSYDLFVQDFSSVLSGISVYRFPSVGCIYARIDA